MRFPDSKRVIYAKNTLEEVICQVRFPPILKISENPAEFQEKVRADYPLFEERPAIDLPANVPPELGRMMTGAGGTKFQFASRDKVWTLTLTRDFLALSCNSYKRWEEFREHFTRPLEALVAAYSPAFFNRTGLRYRNVIRREKLGLGTAHWSQLLRPPICGELAAPEIKDYIDEAARELLVRLDDEGCKVRLMHWLIANEDAYVIDADFFSDLEIEVANVTSKLDAFNKESGRLIRWAITQKLHTAMGPTDA